MNKNPQLERCIKLLKATDEARDAVGRADFLLKDAGRDIFCNIDEKEGEKIQDMQKALMKRVLIPLINFRGPLIRKQNELEKEAQSE